MGPRYLYISILILLLSVIPADAQHVSVEPQDIMVDGQPGLNLAEVWRAETQREKEALDSRKSTERKYEDLDLTVEKKVELNYEQQSGRSPHLTMGYAFPILIQSPSSFRSSCFDPAFPDQKPNFIIPFRVNRDGEFRQFNIRWQSDTEHARKMKELEPYLKVRMKLKRMEKKFNLMSVDLVNTRGEEVIFRFQ